MYDTGYTELYIDLPQYNSVGYMNGSVLSYVSRLPDEYVSFHLYIYIFIISCNTLIIIKLYSIMI